MNKVYYEKIGDEYVPVSEYDSHLMDSFPKGDHLVMCRPGSTSRKYNVVPALAPLIAAAEKGIDEIAAVIVNASELRPAEGKELTPEQHARWMALLDSLEDERRFMLTHGSARAAAQAGVDAMIKESEKMLANPAVKRAWDQFMLVYHMTQETV